jgi:flagellar motor switch protein FliN
MKLEKVNPLVADAMAKAKMTVSVELGTTSKTVKEVHCFAEGTMLKLDNLAGEPLDVKANGVLIAKCEILVTVINENFNVRITEITGDYCQSESQHVTPEPLEPADEEASLKPNVDAINESLQESVKKTF